MSPIDRDAVEALVGAPAQQRLQRRRRHRRVGEDEGEHRRHVGRDHPGALGDAVDRDLDAAEDRRAGRELRECVRRHDRLRGVGPGERVGPLVAIGQHGVELLRVERLADDAGRGEEDLVGTAVRDLRGDLGGEPRRLRALHPGEGVGVAGVHDERPRRADAEIAAAPVDRRRRAFRAREHAGDRGALIERDVEHVGPVLIADAGRRGREADPDDRRQGGKRFRRERRDGMGHARKSGGGRGGQVPRRSYATLSSLRKALDANGRPARADGGDVNPWRAAVDRRRESGRSCGAWCWACGARCEPCVSRRRLLCRSAGYSQTLISSP